MILFAGFLVLASQIQAGKPFVDLLKSRIPGITVKKLVPHDHFRAEYQIMLEQPIDHDDPSAGKFQQLIYLAHYNAKSPMVLETEGYWANRYTRELSKILRGNQIVVEYRFYGKSVPDSIPWKHLTSKQANADLHRVVTLFKKIYKGKWVSTGVSKGGETTMIYRCAYPDDVDASVAYVAPLNLAQEDDRCDQHIRSAGDWACRAKLFEFQRLVLENRDSMLLLLHNYATDKDYKFSIGEGAALEYATLEFTFSFWQWGGHCEDVPRSDASVQEMFDYLEQVVGFYLYCDEGVKKFEPSFYQHMSELGYYGFITEHLQDLLVSVPEPSNLQFAPKGEEIEYDPKYMRRVREWLDRQGNKMIFIYGELDTWSATGYNPSNACDAIRLDLEDGDHGTRIIDFPPAQQLEIYKRLQRWLKADIFPLDKKEAQ